KRLSGLACFMSTGPQSPMNHFGHTDHRDQRSKPMRSALLNGACTIAPLTLRALLMHCLITPLLGSFALGAGVAVASVKTYTWPVIRAHSHELDIRGHGPIMKRIWACKPELM